jgi:hypothetical protein
MILETDASVIAGKVATHSMDADAPLSEQVMQLSIFSLVPHLLSNKLLDLNLSTYIKYKIWSWMLCNIYLVLAFYIV